MEQDIQRVLLTAEAIEAKVGELAAVIRRDYETLNPLVVGVLKGAVFFMADLLKRLQIPCEMDFMAVSSYGASTKTSGVVKIVKDLDQAVEGRHVLLVEDVIDSGLTLKYLLDMFRRRNAQSVKVVTLLDKPEGRMVEIEPDYCGFVMPNEFLVGYGLDYAERYRNLPYIGVLRPEVYREG